MEIKLSLYVIFLFIVLFQISRVFFIACVAASIITIAVDTVETTKQPLDTCELSSYLESIDYDQEVIDVLHITNCTSLKTLENMILYYIGLYSNDNETESYSMGDFLFERNKINSIIGKLQKVSKVRKRHTALDVIDCILISVFTVELLLRLSSCPYLKRYFFSWLNIIDIVVLISSYIELILSALYKNIDYEDKGFKLLYYLQIFRAFRILRFVQDMVSIRVLSHTIVANLKDLMVLFLYIIIAVMIFANFVYFSEDRSNFPTMFEAWWWAIITITTVGYGDIAPKTAIGKVIGSVCALSGVLVLALIIPVIANSFMTLYQFSQIYTKDKLFMNELRNNKIMPYPQEEKPKSNDIVESHICETVHMNKIELKDVD